MLAIHTLSVLQKLAENDFKVFGASFCLLHHFQTCASGT